MDAEELETSGPVVEARSGRRLTPAELDAYARSAWLAVAEVGQARRVVEPEGVGVYSITS